MVSKEPVSFALETIRPYANNISKFDNHIDNQMLREMYKPSFLFADDETHIGIEVEVEGILSSDRVCPIRDSNKSVVGYLWHNTEDGSLRNNGREFVSLPIKGGAIEYSFDKLETYLNKSKSCVGHEFSDRTSVHIHMNARDMTLEQIACFMLLYTAVEPVLYNFCGGQRHKNIFCVPLNQITEEDYLRRFYAGVEKKDNLLNTLDCLRHWKKYCGINLKPLFSYGTIEFRQMVGTLDKEKLLTWINMILLLKKYAVNYSYEVLKKELPQLNTTSEYALLIYNIFGRYSEFLMFSTIQTRMEESVMFIKSCLSEPVENNHNRIISKLLSDGAGEHLLNTAASLNLLIKKPKRKVKEPPQNLFGAVRRPVPPPPPQIDEDVWLQQHQQAVAQAFRILDEDDAVAEDEEDF